MKINKSIVIGGGPAGLTAGWKLAKEHIDVLVVEKYHDVGGIARTEEYKGYRFDIGGHRFFTVVNEVEELWHEWLGSEFVTRPRKSRILYKGKFFNYPLTIINALSGLGIFESIRIIFSYLKAQIFQRNPEVSFEDWVVNRFGNRLYEIFFKTYTEKVWGIKCTEIRAEWAAQRIKGLTLPAAIRNALFPPGGNVIKTLIKEFHYPRKGPGMMWGKVSRLICDGGGRVELNTEAVAINWSNNKVDSVEIKDSSGTKTLQTDYVFSTMALDDLISRFKPSPPQDVVQAASGLKYRDFITVVLIVDIEEVFDDNWVYIHSPDVMIGRIQNFKNWSPDMVPDEKTTSLGLEYFCNVGDEIWDASDSDLIKRAKSEIEIIGLAEQSNVIDATVVRQAKAYPVYDVEYGPLLDTVRTWLSGFKNFHTIGRNGLHKYNNQDHSMLTALRAVDEAVKGVDVDVWDINTDRSYHEEVKVSTDNNRPVDILEA